jgi:hypothetical protein
METNKLTIFYGNLILANIWMATGNDLRHIILGMFFLLIAVILLSTK